MRTLISSLKGGTQVIFMPSCLCPFYNFSAIISSYTRENENTPKIGVTFPEGKRLFLGH